MFGEIIVRARAYRGSVVRGVSDGQNGPDLDPKTRPNLGETVPNRVPISHPIPLLERVFNRMGSFLESLYARARIGVRDYGGTRCQIGPF